MSDPSNRGVQEASQRLSSFMDGEIEPAACAELLSTWAADAGQRGTWHAYHVIGDVLRSEELGCAAADEAFVQRLRRRMAGEPVVFAPQPLPMAGAAAEQPAARADASGTMQGRRPLRWAVPFGAAAGVAAVALTAWITRVQEPDSAVLAAAPRAPVARVVASGIITEPATGEPAASAGRAVATAPVVLAGSAVLPQPGDAVPVHVLRNPQVDRYLSAHRGLSVSPGLGPSASFIRGATFEVSDK